MPRLDTRAPAPASGTLVVDDTITVQCNGRQNPPQRRTCL